MNVQSHITWREKLFSNVLAVANEWVTEKVLKEHPGELLFKCDYGL